MPLRTPLACLAVALILSTTAAYSIAADSPSPVTILAGYSTPEEFNLRIDALAKTPGAGVKTIGRSAGKREVRLITLGRESLADKPAILIVGDVEGGRLAGGEVALRLAERWAAAAADAKSDSHKVVRTLLDRVTIYVLPRPTPDESAKTFRASPVRVPAGNDARTDDDRDGRVGEDPTDDLNGDGLITMLRVADPAGTHRAHPDDPRVLIPVDPKKNERGEYRLLTEGRDDDGDDAFNEDDADGVAFDRNWTFGYKPFAAHTGPHQISEPETRAVADFCFAHPNIAIVLTYSTRDDLFHPWKPESEPGKIKTKIAADDSPFADYVSDLFRITHGGKQPPAAENGAGRFADWAYFHYGRWSFADRLWWVPPVEVKKDASKQDEANNTDAKKDDASTENKEKPAEAKSDVKTAKPDVPKPETHGADQLNALRWLDREKIAGFVPWKAIEHPDFPGRKVEVGGFHPLVLLNPPAKELDGLTDKQSEFVLKLTELLPKLEVRDVKVESLGNGVFRVKLKIADAAYLPSMTAMGELTDQAPPLRYEWDLPADTVWLSGTPRGAVARLNGPAAERELEWLIVPPEKFKGKAKLTVRSPIVGAVIQSIELKP
ncbi:MAG: M14 family metallopeptidase [Pirellulales bacterium]